MNHDDRTPTDETHVQKIVWENAALREELARLKGKDEALRAGERRWATILASIGDAVIASDGAGRITFMNPVAEALTGWTLAEVMQKPVREVFRIINEHTRREVDDPVTLVLEKGLVVGLANHTILVRKDGTELPIDDSGAPIRADDGTTTGVVLVFRDITRRKRMEEALRRSEERFRLVLENSPITVSTMDADLRYTWVHNPAIAVAAEEWVGRRAEDMVPPESVAEMTALRRAVLASGVCDRREMSVPLPDGLHWYDLITEPLRDAAGAVVGLANLAMDITGRKRTEEALRQSEERFRLVLRNSAISVSIMDTDLRYTWVYNPAVRPTAREMVGRHFEELMPPESVAEVSALRRSVLESGIGGRWEVHLPFPEGLRWYDMAVEPLHDAAGAIVGLTSINIDITARVQAETKLRETLQRLQAYLENTPLAVIEWDSQYRVLRWSGEAERIFGWSAEEALGKSVDELRLVPEDETPRVDQLIQDMRSGHMGVNIHHNRNRRKDGAVIYCDWYNSPLLDESGRFASQLALALDVTMRVRAEEQLRQANERLSTSVEELEMIQEELRLANEELLAAHANLEARVAERTAELEQRTEQLHVLAAEITAAEQRERHQLAQVLHDELQQLLAAARLRLQMLRRRLPDGEAPQTASLAQSAQQVDELLGQAIQISRSLTTQLSPPVLHELGLAAGLGWLGQWMQDNHHLAVQVQADPQANPQEEGLRVWLFRCVRELLLNVAKHAGVQTASVRMACVEGGGIEITVCDAGIGFDPESVFASRQLSGGFGMFSMRERIRWLGGQMQVDSAPGRGTRVTLLLPLSVETAATAGAAAAVEATSAHAGTGPGPGPRTRIRVLLADDHAVVRQGLRALLSQEEDIEVVGEAEDGLHAVEQAQKLHPDAVVMDVSMPQMGGIEAARRIRALLPRTRVVALTMHEEPTLKTAMLQAGAVAYLSKSGPTDELLAAIRGPYGGTDETGTGNAG